MAEEILEGRILSDEEVLRMEKSQTDIRIFSKLTDQMARENYRRMQDIIDKNLHSAFFRDL